MAAIDFNFLLSLPSALPLLMPSTEFSKSHSYGKNAPTLISPRRLPLPSGRVDLCQSLGQRRPSSVLKVVSVFKERPAVSECCRRSGGGGGLHLGPLTPALTLLHQHVTHVNSCLLGCYDFCFDPTTIISRNEDPL